MWPRLDSGEHGADMLDAARPDVQNHLVAIQATAITREGAFAANVWQPRRRPAIRARGLWPSPWPCLSFGIHKGGDCGFWHSACDLITLLEGRQTRGGIGLHPRLVLRHPTPECRRFRRHG